METTMRSPLTPPPLLPARVRAHSAAQSLTLKSLTLTLLALTPLACDDSARAPGGSSPLGGAQVGGVQAGGAQTGGSQTGGAQAGGAQTGGSQTGGSQTGGAQTGGSQTGGSQTGGAQTGGSQTGGAQEIDLGCEPQEVLNRSSCATAGCHAPPVAASLDLSLTGGATLRELEGRLTDAPAHSAACRGRVLLDPRDPSRSLLLQVVGAAPPPGGASDLCQVVMPPGATVGDGAPIAEADKACLARWADAVSRRYLDAHPAAQEVFEPSPVASALRKVKALTRGDAPTAEEVAAVEADAGALEGLVRGWAAGEAFERKLSEFLEISLQQRLQAEDIEQFDRLRRHRSRNAPFRRVMEESFVRTALDIVRRGAPFTEVLTTRRWMVTTANLVLLRYPDQTAAERGQTHEVVRSAADAPTALRNQVAQRRWHIPNLGLDCELEQEEALEMLFGFLLRSSCTPRREVNIRFDNPPLTLADFEDWRWVELVTPQEAPDAPLIPFYDLPALRGATQVATRIPRGGFFTTSVFFNNWPTNVDNQFRVTTNQAVLAALHTSFTATEATAPQHTNGLSADHAEEGTACYGCHRQLDPMRLYFARAYNVSYQRPTTASGDERLFPTGTEAGFTFYGVSEAGGGLARFGELLGEHPRFPTAWVQKLCLYANSTPCDEHSPDVIALKERFSASGLNLLDLWVGLMSSPLVTGLTPTTRGGAPTLDAPPISVTRRAHLCAQLDERAGQRGICDTPRVLSVLGLIPDDDFARGAADFTQPARPSAFYFAAAEAVCEAAAATVITQGGTTFPVSAPEVALDALVSRLMALPPNTPRHASVRAALSAHYTATLTQSAPLGALREAFTLACLSPEVMGVGL